MNTQSLNRSIGLAMSALQQARANGNSAQAIDAIRWAIRFLNKARVSLKRGNVQLARFFITNAYADIKFAISAR
jgi:hypothetical protein